MPRPSPSPLKKSLLTALCRVACLAGTPASQDRKREIAADKVARVGSSRHRRRRSNKLIAAVIAIAIVAAIGGGSALAYLNVKGRLDRLQAALVVDLQAGQRELEAGKASLTQANTKRDQTLIKQAVDHFGTAKTQFLAASQLADNSRLLHDLEQIPAAGSYAS